MPMLTDTDIKKLLDTKAMSFSPFKSDRLTPSGYNLSAGHLYLSKRDLKKVDVPEDGHIVIAPGDTVSILVEEKISLPSDCSISGLLLPKVKLLHRGLTKPVTTLDADYNAPLMIDITNISVEVVEIKRGDAICTVVFFENKSPSTIRSNNALNESEMVEFILGLWSLHRRTLSQRAWRVARPLLPVGLIIGAGALAFIFLRAHASFGGVMGAIGVAAVLVERLLHKRGK